MSNGEKNRSGPQNPWQEAAIAVCRSPFLSVKCPLCGTLGVLGKWNLLHEKSREISVDLHCSACGSQESVQIEMPDNAFTNYPFERLPLFAQTIAKEVESIAIRVRQYIKSMPAAAFTTHPLWAEAKWSATTYKFHPTSEAPPIMGLVFENVEAGLEIFREAERQMKHEDRFEEIRVSIIEGAVPGQEHRPGYSIHICADPDAIAAHATLDDFVVDPTVVPFLGQWNRHYPVPGEPPMLAKFKEEFEKHKEFLLAPTIRRDGQLFMEPMLGIVKNVIFFRQLSDINSPDDPDATALLLPQFITPPV
ncbi:MAG: hypothetical protein JXB10_04245 [Pirellulales bacterium]|nr:hypothetical protein [Pirellulales bacterium]